MRPFTQFSSTLSLKGMCCLTIVLAGFLPVGSIALHCLQLISLPVCLLTLIAPAIMLVFISVIRFPDLKQIVTRGWLAGILAVALYDLSRVPYILNGWNDFIPQIGAWASNSTQPDALLGYLWRYAGNGGGMGIAFFILMKHFRPFGNMIQNGVLFGLFVFSSLMFVLIFSEQAQDMMFRVTPLSFTGSLTGHLVYGLVLGVLAKGYFKWDLLENPHAEDNSYHIMTR